MSEDEPTKLHIVDEYATIDKMDEIWNSQLPPNNHRMTIYTHDLMPDQCHVRTATYEHGPHGERLIHEWVRDLTTTEQEWGLLVPHDANRTPNEKG